MEEGKKKSTYIGPEGHIPRTKVRFEGFTSDCSQGSESY